MLNARGLAVSIALYIQAAVHLEHRDRCFFVRNSDVRFLPRESRVRALIFRYFPKRFSYHINALRASLSFMNFAAFYATVVWPI